MKNTILQLPLDKTKRHFIVGDIHGRFRSFMKLLEEAKYNSQTDVVYSVGDMIDRGPKSYEVVKFFTTQPNTYAVMGNHEYMVTSLKWQSTWLKNGGVECLLSLDNHGKNQQWLAKKVENLPWIIEVGEPSDADAFRILHAEFPPTWDDDTLYRVLNEAIDGEDPRAALLVWSRKTIEHALRNIGRSNPLCEDIVFNTNRTRHNFVGHTPVRKAITVGDMTYLDTYGDNTMTMVEALSRQVYTTTMID